MDPRLAMQPLDMDLDILGQQDGLSNLYTQLCFCYARPDDTSMPRIITTLREGLGRLATGFPWIAGQVVQETQSQEGEGQIYKIKPLESIPRLIVKDLTDDSSIPTMEAYRRAHFPFSMLDESIFAPYKTLAAGTEEVATSSPVFAIQITLISGGLFLTFVTQHNVMDMTGQGQIMKLMSKACSNIRFTAEELKTGNLERMNLIPLLDESYQPGPELAHQIAKSASQKAQFVPPPGTAIGSNSEPTCSWAYFGFSAQSLVELKALAMKHVTRSSGYVSTDDTLTAYIWQSVMQARLPRVGPTTETTLARAIDPRRYLGIPETYTGLVQNMTYHTHTVQQLIDTPLGTIASELRSAVDPRSSTIGYDSRALVTHYLRAKDKSRIGVTINLNQTIDIALSSWSKVDCAELDFNLGLGRPECVRRPQFTPVEGLLYFMPKALNGEIAVALCLRDDDMQNLRANEQFGRYASYVG